MPPYPEFQISVESGLPDERAHGTHPPSPNPGANISVCRGVGRHARRVRHDHHVERGVRAGRTIPAPGELRYRGGVAGSEVMKAGAARGGGACNDAESGSCWVTEKTATGSAKPRNARVPSAASGIECRISAAAAGSIRIWPSSAEAQSRDAKFTTVPIAV